MAKTDPAIEWLANVALFEHVDRRGLGAIHNSMRARSFRAGTVIVEEGNDEGRFYLITEGKATVTVKRKPVHVLGPGDYFGEISLIDRGRLTSITRGMAPRLRRGVDDAYAQRAASGRARQLLPRPGGKIEAAVLIVVGGGYSMFRCRAAWPAAGQRDP